MSQSVISYGSISKCPLYTQEKFTDVTYTPRVVPQLNNYMYGMLSSTQKKVSVEVLRDFDQLLCTVTVLQVKGKCSSPHT